MAYYSLCGHLIHVFLSWPVSLIMYMWHHHIHIEQAVRSIWFSAQLRYQYSNKNSICFWDSVPVQGSNVSGWRQETGSLNLKVRAMHSLDTNSSKLWCSRLWCCSMIYASERGLGGSAKLRALHQKLLMGKIGAFITVLISKLWFSVLIMIFF